MKTLSFSKYSGAGNDFILVDHRSSFFQTDDIQSFAVFVRGLCHRQEGIGADGLILLENPSYDGDFRMRIFNSNGFEAEMCGNGLRTLIHFIASLGIRKDVYLIESFHSVKGECHSGTIHGDDVILSMANPREIKWDLCVDIDHLTLKLDFLDTGVPHAVLFVDSVDSVDLQKMGPFLRYHPLFSPRGTNVNIVSRNDSILMLRTYERGVEAETLACGTGAVASAIAVSRHLNLKPPLNLLVRSGSQLTVDFSSDANFKKIYNIKLQGPAKKIYEGYINY